MATNQGSGFNRENLHLGKSSQGQEFDDERNKHEN